MAQPEWTIEGKIPLVWVIDDTNTALAAACRARVGLFAPDHLGRLRELVERTRARLSFNFVIEPEYSRAGLTSLADYETAILAAEMGPYHVELQDWLAQLGERAEVTVHGWSHRMASYDSEVEIKPGGSPTGHSSSSRQYTRRSEWLHHDDPVGNYRRCIDVLKGLGYRPVTHAFSNCGGRMDRETLRKLRESEFGVLTKFPTQVEACRADYPEVPEMPWHLEDVDAFIFPWDLDRETGDADFERVLRKGRAIFLLNHGYEFCGANFETVNSAGALERFVRVHANEIVFVRLGEYARTMHERTRGEA